MRNPRLFMPFLLSLSLLAATHVQAATFTRALTIGSKGSDVSALQQILKDEGYFTYPTITGFYGRATYQAVAAFQKANNLESVGHVGPLTRALLNSSTSSINPSVPTSTNTPAAGNSTAATTTSNCPTTNCLPGTSIPQPVAPGGGYTPGFGGGGNPVTPADTTAPSVPTGLSLTAGDGSATVAWTDPSDSDLNTIKIYRGTTSTSLSLLTTVSKGVGSYVDTSVSNGTIYYYALSAVDSTGNESSQGSTLSTTPNPYFTQASNLFSNTGRVAVWADASNLGAGITNQVGSNRNANEWGPLVGSPIYIMGREMTTNTWLGYEVITRGTVDDRFINQTSQSIYKPAKFIRFDAGTTVADNGSGGSAVIPLDASGTSQIRFKLHTLDTAVTDLALAVVYLNNNINKLATVTISGASVGTVAPNLLHTATQAVADGWLATSSLVSQSGTIPDNSYVLATNVLGRSRLGNSGFQSVPIASGLTPDDYTVTVTVTTVNTNGESSATSRAYIGGLFYHSDAITDSTSGMYMARMGYVSANTDGSTNDTFYMNGHPAAGGSDQQIGKNHGNETQTAEPTLLVDGVSYRMTGKSATRTRTSNVATVVTALPHGLTTGDIVTMSGFGSTTYSKNEVAVTVLDANTFTYADSGANEATTTDTTGRYIRKGIKVGASSIQLSQPSQFFHPNYGGGTTPIGSETTTYTLAGKTFTTHATGTLSIDFIHSSSFGILSSYWSGDPTTKGPVYPGAATAKAYLPTQSKTTLNANDDSSALHGQSLTFVLSRATSDLADAINITSTTGNSAFGSNWSTFIRDLSGGSVEKVYLKLPDVGSLTTSAGWTFDYSSDRVDGYASGAKTSSIFGN